MANTYSKLYVHVVFTVKGRMNLIPIQHKDELFKFMTGIVQNNGQKLLCINGMPDHVHILLGIKPEVSVSTLVKEIKANSSRFINENKWIAGKFEWQTGFGAFSYSESQVDKVYKYIKNQDIHHRTKSFKEEYIEILQKFKIEYKDEYLFEFL